MKLTGPIALDVIAISLRREHCNNTLMILLVIISAMCAVTML
jgi:hypothetical protein